MRWAYHKFTKLTIRWQYVVVLVKDVLVNPVLVPSSDRIFHFIAIHTDQFEELTTIDCFLPDESSLFCDQTSVHMLANKFSHLVSLKISTQYLMKIVVVIVRGKLHTFSPTYRYVFGEN